jgi:bifunctional DNA-binding transcriptional regulator/antitoxin component of YhaV-PrlF toxin-antitoxin module/predicted GIY-YIG superfamily endonuclease
MGGLGSGKRSKLYEQFEEEIKIKFKDEYLLFKKNNQMISGIYMITNIVNYKKYIGSSINLHDRCNKHKAQLKNNKHHNFHLQNAWDKYGEENFKFEIIELVSDKEKLIEREQYWIDKLDTSNQLKGYNLNPIAGSQLGRKVPKENREKFKLSQKSRPILQFDFDGKLIKEWYSAREICRELNIDRSVVISRLRGHNFGYMLNTFWVYKDKYTDEELQIRIDNTLHRLNNPNRRVGRPLIQI